MVLRGRFTCGGPNRPRDDYHAPPVFAPCAILAAPFADLEPLFRSAEGYVRMWERAEARAAALR